MVWIGCNMELANDLVYLGVQAKEKIFKADRLQMIVVAKKYICVATVHQ